jgi:hypothetical protein
MIDLPHAYPLLSPESCTSLCNRVFDLREHWFNMTPDCEAYALGSASYMALAADAYKKRVECMNPVLRRHFGELYGALFDALDPVLRDTHAGPLVWESGYGLPGFQILLVNDRLDDPRGNVSGPHWDWNFYNLPWDPPLPDEIDLTCFASFTLPLSLPRAGGGLHVWESLTSADVDEYAAERGLREWEAAEELTRDQSSVYQPYANGTLVVHSGHLVHQIAPWELQAGDARVTMQGHALYHGDRWQIYW